MSMDEGNASDHKNHMKVEVINGTEEKMKPGTSFERTEKLQDGERRTVSVPAHMYTLLMEYWWRIFVPVIEHLQVQVRFDRKTNNVELQAAPGTSDTTALEKAAAFVTAFTYGFDIEDVLVFLRSDDLYIETFEIQDVKRLKGVHRARAIVRLALKGENMKLIIEDLTVTRIVFTNSIIRILGSYQGIQLAKRAICSIILGRPPSKVYEELTIAASRVIELK